jgi:hypothetical protein
MDVDDLAHERCSRDLRQRHVGRAPPREQRCRPSTCARTSGSQPSSKATPTSTSTSGRDYGSGSTR